MGGSTDECLVRELMLGRPEAFERLAAQYERPLLNFLVGFVGDPATADDLFQETLVRVVRSISEYRPQAGLATWIFAIARNLALDQLRRRKRRREVPADANVIFLQADPAAGPTSTEASDKLSAALQQLSPKKREVVVMRFFADHTYEEMSRLLDTPEGTLKFRLHEALRELAGLLRGEQRHEVSGSA